MKLIIQIPCYNEEESLPITLRDLPREVAGFDVVEWLVIDDGSSDKTAEVARSHGVDHVVRLPQNKGLARAFMAGLEASLRRGADVIVNTDADNQYDARNIPALTAPILEGEAQITIGTRPISEIEHFSAAKKLLQRLGSWVVKVASGSDVPDAPSGFRGYSKEVALQVYVVNSFTYTLETLIQAGRKNFTIKAVPVEVNAPLRESRLIRSIPDYIWRSAITIIRIFIIYKPLRFFTLAAAIIGTPGIIGILRFLYNFAIGEGQGNLQSLTISAGLLATAAVFQMGGFLADIIAVNRFLLEDMRARMLRESIEKTL